MSTTNRLRVLLGGLHTWWSCVAMAACPAVCAAIPAHAAEPATYTRTWTLESKHGAGPLAFSADGALVFAHVLGESTPPALRDGIAAVERKTGALLGFAVQPGDGKPAAVAGLAATARLGEDAVLLWPGDTSAAHPADVQWARCNATPGRLFGAPFPFGGKGGAVYEFDAKSGARGKQVARYDAKTQHVTRLVANPACTRLLLVQEGPHSGVGVDVFDIASGKALTRLVTKGVTSAAWSRNEQTIATLDNKGVVGLWSAADGKRLREFRTADGQLGQVLYRSDGALVVVPLAGAVVAIVLDAETGAERQRLETGACRARMAVAQAPDGTAFAVSCRRDTDIGLGTAIELYSIAGP